MSYSWNSETGYYEENGQKARIVYLNFVSTEIKNDREPYVLYNNSTLEIDPASTVKDNRIAMQSGVPENSSLASTVLNALNARNYSFYNEAGEDIKIVYVATAPTEGNFSTIYVGKPNSDKAVVVNKSATFAVITEVTGPGADEQFGEGFVLTTNLPLTAATGKWDNKTSDETKAAITNEWMNTIQRAADRLMGIYTCADGTVDTIDDFQDAAADCHDTIYWKKNPADATDNGHWVAYDSTGAHTKKIIVLDFDGVKSSDQVFYKNEALNITQADGYQVTGTAYLTDETTIQSIVDALNNAPQNTEYLYMANTKALSTANGQYNTVYVGNLHGLADEGQKYSLIAEATAGLCPEGSTKPYWQNSFGNGYVLAQNMTDHSVESYVANIKKAAGHVTGTYSHPDSVEGVSLGDFYEGTITGPNSETWDPSKLGGIGAYVDEQGNAIRLVRLVFDSVDTTYTNVNDDLMSQDPGSRAWRQFNYKNLPVTMQCAIADSDSSMQQTICNEMNAMGLTVTKNVNGTDYTANVKFFIGGNDVPCVSTIYIGNNTNRTYNTGSDGFYHWLTGLPMEQCRLTTNGKQNTTTYTGYSSIVEASGENADEWFANGFVLTESLPTKQITIKVNNKDTKVNVLDFSDTDVKQTLESYIATATQHLMGEYSHDYGHNGVTIDDFYESFKVDDATIASAIESMAYELGGIIENVVIDGRTFTNNGLYFRSGTVSCSEDQSSASYDHGIRTQEAYVLNGTFTNNVAGKTISTKNGVTVPAPIIYASRISAVTLDNCDFENNRTGCIFVENECGHSAHNARVTVGNATFSANTTTESTGGIVDIEVGGNLYMGHSQITDNVIAGTNTSADGYGAAIYATQKSSEGDVNVYLEGSTFSGNTAAVEGFSRAVYVDQGLAAGKNTSAYENYLYLDNTTFADKNQRVVSLGQVNMRDTNTFAADFYNDGGHTVTFTTETDEDGNTVPALMKFVNQDEIFVDAKMDTSEGNAQVELDGSKTVNFGSWLASTSSSSADLAAKLNADGTHKTLDEMETLIGGDFDDKFTALNLNSADVIVNQEAPFEEAAFELGASHIYATGITLREDVENVYYNGATAASLEDIDELQMMNKKRDIATGESYDFGKLAYVVNYTMMAEAATEFNNIWFNVGGTTSQGSIVEGKDLDNKYFIGNNTYKEAFHDKAATIIAGNNKITNGGDINEFGAELVLEGTLFADGYRFELNNLTWNGSLFGGSTATMREGADGTNLFINGVTFSAADTKIVGGGQNCGTGTGDINVNINDDKLDKTATIYGAGETADTAITTGNVTLTVNAKNHDNLARIYAGGHADGESASITTGNITTTFTVENDDRQFGAFYGGALLENGASFNAGTITTTIQGGNFLSFVGNGSKTANGKGENTTEIEETVLIIQGGNFANLVYAGGYSNGDSVSVGYSTLAISGGTFAKSVYGGCAANNDTNGTLGTIAHDITVTVNATTASPVVFNSNLYAGSMGEAQIGGNTYLTFSGIGDALSFDDLSYVSGNSRLGSQFGNTKKDYVAGDRVLTFNDFSGDFGGNMCSGFEKVNFIGSTVAFTGKQKVDLQFTDTWSFQIGGTAPILTWDAVENSAAFNYNNFSKDTLNLSFAEDFTLSETATIIQGCDATLRNWDKFGSVTLNGGALTWNDADAYVGSVGGTDYKLFVEDNSLKLGLA